MSISKLFRVLKIICCIVCVFIICICIWLITLAHKLPNYNSLLCFDIHKITRIYTSDLCLIEEYGKEKRVYTSIDQIPQIVINAFVAAEDKNFFSHKGFDITGIIRSSIKFLSYKIQNKKISGASTITQQVVKNLLLDNSRTLERKAKEVMLSYLITKNFDKRKILELYLNHIYFGSGVYGVAEAARYYFNRKLEDLTLDEIALLAGILPAPSKYVQEQNRDLIKARRNYVLLRMKQDSYIDNQQYQQYIHSKVELRKNIIRNNTINAHHVADRVREIVIDKFGEKYFYNQGLTIVTSINSDYQKQANLSLKQGMQNYNNASYLEKEEVNQQINGAILVLNHRTGQVLAMSGGTDSFDRATMAKRQVGSLVKTFVYLSALENNIEPNTVFIDEDIAIDQGDPNILWEPKNIERNFLGPMTMRYAFEKSCNVVTVKVGMQVGLSNVLDLMSRCKIHVPQSKAYLSILLGAAEATLQDVVTAYSCVANGGQEVDVSFIEYIQNHRGEFIYKRKNLTSDSNKSDLLPTMHQNEKNYVIEPASAYQMINFLQGSAKRGTARRLTQNINIPLAGRTGTTNNNCDTWFVGFDANIIVGSYMGFDLPQSLGKKAVGATVALPVVKSFFQGLIAMNNTNLIGYFPRPSNVCFKDMDLITGVEKKTESSILECFKINSVEKASLQHSKQ